MDDRSSSAFASASAFFVDTVSLVSNDRWGQPGLGEWSVRQLVAHTNRAHTTVVETSTTRNSPNLAAVTTSVRMRSLPETAKRLPLAVPTHSGPSKPPPSQRSSSLGGRHPPPSSGARRGRFRLPDTCRRAPPSLSFTRWTWREQSTKTSRLPWVPSRKPVFSWPEGLPSERPKTCRSPSRDEHRFPPATASSNRESAQHLVRRINALRGACGNIRPPRCSVRERTAATNAGVSAVRHGILPKLTSINHEDGRRESARLVHVDAGYVSVRMARTAGATESNSRTGDRPLRNVRSAHRGWRDLPARTGSRCTSRNSIGTTRVGIRRLRGGAPKDRRVEKPSLTC